MPSSSSSSSSSSIYISSQFSRRPKIGSGSPPIINNMRSQQEPKKVSNGSMVKEEKARYGECRKNHAASLGGHAVDGCREFMASGGEEGTSAALKCAACNCHRNFHKRVVESEVLCNDCSSNSNSPR